MKRFLPCALLLLGNCAGEQGAQPYSATGDRAAVLAALDGFGDPVSGWLRGRVTERGTVRGTYRDVLDGVGGALGCDGAGEKSFTVVSNAGYIPKTVFTRCSQDAAAASRFFLALPAVDDDADVEPRIVHVVGWDAAAGRFRHYSLAPAPGTPAGEMAIGVEPAFCLDCHGGPHKLPAWQPLMNEMTNPWAHWDAQPAFASLLFDEHLDPATRAGARYRAATAGAASASELEPIVRAGIERFVSARLAERAAPASGATAAALDLVRPLFCDETVNYVSEIHDTGELRASAVVDDGLRQLLGKARPGRWSFAAEPTLSLPPPRAGEAALTLIPVRGTSTIEAELGLVARGVISVDDALRVRAVDWQHPVMSDARCDLWRAGRERLLARGLEGATVGDAAAAALRELLDGVPEVSVDELGDAVAARLAATTRAGLAVERRARVCRAVETFPSAPLYDDIDCM